MQKSTEADLLSKERQTLDSEFVRKYKHGTNEEILEYLRSVARELGKIPTKHEVMGYFYIKSRLGPWPRVLEMAGLKEVSKRQYAKQQKLVATNRMNKKNAKQNMGKVLKAFKEM